MSYYLECPICGKSVGGNNDKEHKGLKNHILSKRDGFHSLSYWKDYHNKFKEDKARKKIDKENSIKESLIHQELLRVKRELFLKENFTITGEELEIIHAEINDSYYGVNPDVDSIFERLIKDFEVNYMNNIL